MVFRAVCSDKKNRTNIPFPILGMLVVLCVTLGEGLSHMRLIEFNHTVIIILTSILLRTKISSTISSMRYRQPCLRPHGNWCLPTNRGLVISSNGCFICVWSFLSHIYLLSSSFRNTHDALEIVFLSYQLYSCNITCVLTLSQ